MIEWIALPVMAKVLMISCLVLIGSLGGWLAAQSPDDLAREINTELRAAQNLMFSGKIDEAAAKVAHIEELMGQLQSVEPDSPKLKTLQPKLDKLKKDLERRQPKPAAASAPAAPAPATGGGEAMPAGASRCLREMDRALEKAERALTRSSGSPDSKTEQARYEMKTAEMYWQDLQKKYPETLQHPDVLAARQRVEDMYARIETAEGTAAAAGARAAEADAARDAQSREWLTRLKPFVAHRGEDLYDPDKEFIAGYTEQKDELDQRMRLYAAAYSLMAEYRKADFSAGTSDELEQVAKELDYRLESFQSELQSMSEMYFREIDDELNRNADFFQRNMSREKPLLLDEGVLSRLSAKIAWVEGLRPGDSRIPDLKSRYQGLLDTQSAAREKMVDSTRVLPEKYSGGDIGALREKARDVVMAKHGGAEILRVSVISPDWQEERALEFTDTTRSAIRYRITRSVTVQVAAKQSGGCYLYSVYVGQDRRSDGSWGPLKGHIMFTDRILEGNVDK